MTVEPTPNDDQAALQQLVDAWLDAEPGTPRRAQLAAQLAQSPAGRMWLAARDTLVDLPGTPDLVAGTAADLREVAQLARLGEPNTRKMFFGTLVTVRQWAAVLMALAAITAALAGVMLAPAPGGGLSGTGVGGQMGGGSIVLLVLAAVLGVLAWALWRRR